MSSARFIIPCRHRPTTVYAFRHRRLQRIDGGRGFFHKRIMKRTARLTQTFHTFFETVTLRIIRISLRTSFPRT